MSRRNLILLIIVLVTLLALGVWIFSSRPTTNTGTEDDGGFFSNLNPFGKTTIVPPKTNEENGITEDENPPTDTEKRKFTKVSTMPVAGYAAFQKEKVLKEFHPALRYVARATGNIYQTFADDVKEVKFSSTVIPKIYEAHFGNSGDTVIMRYLKSNNTTIQTFLGNLPKEKVGEETQENIGTAEVRGSFLPENISDLSVSADTTKIFYLLNTGEKESGITLNLKDNKKTQIFDSPFTEWLPAWSGNTVFLTTKASGLALGYIYKIESNRQLSKVFGDVNGLVTLPSPNGKTILISDGNLSLSIYDMSTKELQPLSIRTIADKCIWSKDSIKVYCAVPKDPTASLYPDAWYQGEVSFNDQIWELNIQNKNANFTFDPSALNGGEEIDGIKLGLDEKESYLFFVNKKDSFLWEYNLK